MIFLLETRHELTTCCNYPKVLVPIAAKYPSIGWTTGLQGYLAVL
jgi:hypothetical protein